MIFIETSAFSRQIGELLSDEEYGELQRSMIGHPDAGAVIQGDRWPAQAALGAVGPWQARRVRVVYYWLSTDHQIRMLMIYPKSMKDDLSAPEKRALRNIVENWNG